MRIAIVIISLAAVAVCLVNIRRMEMTARNETIRLLELREIQLNRKHWGQDVDLGYLTAWEEVERRAGEQGLQFGAENRRWYCLADGQPAGDQRGER